MAGKIAIYQVLPRLFGNTNENCIPNSSFYVNGCGKFDHLRSDILIEIKSFGYTHIWLTGIIRHASQTAFPELGIDAAPESIVKGEAGSPYSIIDYYDVSPDLAVSADKRIEEFENLVRRCHSSKLKVIIDFVPNHVSRAYFSVAKPDGVKDFGERDKVDYPFHPMNNFYYIPGSEFVSPVDSKDITPDKAGNINFTETPAKATGNNCFNSKPAKDDWYETAKLNYGVDILNGGVEYFKPIPDTWFKMRDILLFWAEKDIDGFRCDMASMVPLQFWEWVIPQIKASYKSLLFIAEIYEKELYEKFLSSGFDLLYDKVGLYDTLRAVTTGFESAEKITECWRSLNGHEDRMLNFLENHDEQRIASDFFAGDSLKAIPALTVMLLLNRAPFLIYFGQELGERGMDKEGFSSLDGRTSIYDYWSVSTVREWIKTGKLPLTGNIYKKLIKISLSEPAIVSGKKYDLQYANRDSSNYDIARLYSFLRKSDDSLIMTIVSFSSDIKTIRIKIPRNAFEYLGIDKEVLEGGSDLFDEDSAEYTLIPDVKTEISLNSLGIKIIKFLL